MSKKKRKPVLPDELLPDELFYFIEAHDDDSAPDGAWWQMLEDAVTYWNDEHGTHYDENETVHAYVRWAEDNGKATEVTQV